MNDRHHLEEFNNELLEVLERSGVDLINGKDCIKILRDIRQFLLLKYDAADYNDSDNDHSLFLSFFLKLFIEEVFSNLIRDIIFVDDFTEELQSRFCKAVGQAFYDLGVCLEEHRYEEVYSYYMHLGIAYLTTVQRLNKNI